MCNYTFHGYQSIYELKNRSLLEWGGRERFLQLDQAIEAAASQTAAGEGSLNG